MIQKLKQIHKCKLFKNLQPNSFKFFILWGTIYILLGIFWFTPPATPLIIPIIIIFCGLIHYLYAYVSYKKSK